MTLMPHYSTSGNQLTALKAADRLFKAKINHNLMAEAVRIFLANRRAANAQTKVRNEVQVTHAKVWRQKGTGRARHGSRNAPIFVGGAKAHGPSGRQNYYRRLSRGQRQAGLFAALSSQFKGKNMLAVSGWEKLQLKTKIFDETFQRLKLEKAKILLVTGAQTPKWLRAVRNLPYLSVLPASGLSVYPVLRARKIVFTKDGLEDLGKHYV